MKTIAKIVLLIVLCIGIGSFYFKKTAIVPYEKMGRFESQDKFGAPIILEWHKTEMLSPDFQQMMKSAWDIACPAYVPVEMQFLKRHPDVVGKDEYFKPFEPFFKNGPKNVDWNTVEEKMQMVLKQSFIFDSSTFSPDIAKMFADDHYIFVEAKDKKMGTTLGFITFLMRPNYKDGDVKVTSLAILPSAQNRGLAKLLISSIFKTLPNFKRIFLSTRGTNENALRAYQSWGFTQDLNPIQDPHYSFDMQHWTFLEYIVGQSDALQKAANTLKEIYEK